jgi:o-succinylbenzoate---CoA ligase
MWDSSESHLLMNPTYSKSEQERFSAILIAAHDWPAHIWLSTSGSSVQKWVGLSKQAVLASAQAVNQHLNSHREDRWVNALPFFHVGGLGIEARAYLSGAKVYDFKKAYPGKWQVEQFYTYIQEVNGTLCALVPAQLHDLVVLGKQAPSSLRALIIGGGALLPSLYERAVALGWPVLPSYGLTECASQVATAPLESWRKHQIPPLQLLPHLQACEREDRLCFKGDSLLSTYAYIDQQEVRFLDPKIEGWLVSEDRGIIQDGQLHVLGRADAMLKVGGENVDLARLENHLQTLRLQIAIEAEATLIAMPDSRLGHCLHLASNSLTQEKIAPLIDQFQQTVLPFERIRKIHLLPRLPRSSLGKILKSELKVLINSTPEHKGVVVDQSDITSGKF